MRFCVAHQRQFLSVNKEFIDYDRVTNRYNYNCNKYDRFYLSLFSDSKPGGDSLAESHCSNSL
jgi:hypothetical protein